MAGIYLVGFENWAPIVDGPVAIDHRWSKSRVLGRWLNMLPTILSAIATGLLFPPSPLPKDFQALSPSYELVVAEEVAQRFELPELPPVIFYRMLLNEAERLGVLYGQMLREESLRSRQEEEGLGAEREEEGLEAEREEESSATKGAASPLDDDKPERATHLPRPHPDDYQDLCLHFLLPEAERVVLDFELPEMVQATFYAILLNDAIELCVVRNFIADDLKSTLVGLRWTCFETWLIVPPATCGKRNFVAARYAHDSSIPEMVQAIFYAMVVDDVAELGLSRRLTMDCVMWAMRKLG
ncbi:hypothetical protein Cgig2_015680 [Carnegiea gigantea]|uniref:Uncharacterized protein n=1 Tax=Carnegiea gigantea TaxID=171969 RepID=A0A9Q1Q6N9_9CARY|nr:hypothetical protein Cgig2_015680 [Carnegiea gigantea]